MGVHAHPIEETSCIASHAPLAIATAERSSPDCSGRLEWVIGPGAEADVVPASAELLALIPTPEFEDIESDREFYIVGDENWSVRHSDVFEGAELRGTYSYAA